MINFAYSTWSDALILTALFVNISEKPMIAFKGVRSS